MNSGCRSQTTCQCPDSINLFSLVADRFGGKHIDDVPKENSISLMELAMPNLSLITHFECFLLYVDSVQTCCHRVFSHCSSKTNKLCSMLTAINKTHLTITLRTMRTCLISVDTDYLEVVLYKP